MGIPPQIMGMLMPNGQPPQQPPQQRGGGDDATSDRVPIRIVVAIKYLDNLSHYEQKMGISGCPEHGGSAIIPGIETDLDNQHARKAACEMLASFFSGTFEPKPWDLPSKEPMQREGKAIRCIACRDGSSPGNPQEPCTLCQGTRSILVFPIETPGV